MEQRVFMLSFLVLLLGTLFEVRGWPAPNFCHDYDCPEFEVVKKNEAFEERVYVESRWITTKVPSTKSMDLIQGFSRLKQYCNGKNEQGTQVFTKTWPALITLTEGEDGSDTNVSVSWFVPVNTVLPKPTDPLVTEESRPAGTVYVKVFEGSITAWHSYAEELHEALVQEGTSFKPHRYTGAGYDNPMNFFIHHHNEVWLYADN
ncbi:heme-binding protein soul2 [Polymixia lowei]